MKRDNKYNISITKNNKIIIEKSYASIPLLLVKKKKNPLKKSLKQLFAIFSENCIIISVGVTVFEVSRRKLDIRFRK